MRSSAVLLAASIVIAACFVLAPQWHLPSSENQRVDHGAPPADDRTPGGDAAIRRVIGELRDGRVDRNDMPGANPRLPWVLERLGPVKSVDYLGSDTINDLYRVTFAKGSLRAAISLGRGGVVDRLRFTAPKGPTPQDWIDSYALIAWGDGAAGSLMVLMKFAGVVALGLIVGIRL